MIEVGKYYKRKGRGIVVRAISGEVNGEFAGQMVTTEYGCRPVGENTICVVVEFEPCEAPQTPQPDPNKDTELRLECLKLAIQSNQGVWQSPETVTTDADHYYEWITKQ